MSEGPQPAGWNYREYRFGSGLIGRLRGLWFAVAARWANVDLVAQLNTRDEIIAAQLVAQDRELAELRHDLGAATTRIIALQRELAALQARRAGDA